MDVDESNAVLSSEAFAMFSRSAAHVATVNEWAARAPRRGAERAARDYARRHMVAVVMRGDDSAVAFRYDVASGRVARVVYPKVTWAA